MAWKIPIPVVHLSSCAVARLCHAAIGSLQVDALDCKGLEQSGWSTQEKSFTDNLQTFC